MERNNYYIMEKECCISIIVSIYNVEKYLKQCLDSVCCQASDDIEVILVDDGSTDDSGKICDEYVTNNINVKVIHKKNGGLVSARKAGVRVAKSKYITFVDGDDWIDNDWYEKAKIIIEKNDVDILAYGYKEEYCDFNKIVNNNKSAGIYNGKSLEILKENAIVNQQRYVFWEILPHVWNKIFKRNLIKKYIKNVDDIITFGEDAACTYPCIWGSESILITEDTPYHYRQRVDSMSKDYLEMRNDSFLRIKCCLTMAGENANVSEQIKIYILFLFMLRKYSELSKYNMTLFPFQEINLGDRIVIYGAGGFGKSLYNYIDNTGCVRIAGIVDGKGIQCSTKDFVVQDVKEIKNMEYDYIVIAILNENITRSIADNLIKMGIEQSKIIYVKMDVLREMDDLLE